MKYASDLYLLAIMKNDFTGNTLPDEVFFDCVEKELMKSTALDDDCIIAWLLKRMDAVMLSDRQIKTIQHRMKDLVRRGKMLEEFKYYSRYFELPSTLANNIIISAFSEDPESQPYIAYEITGSGAAVSGMEEMEEIFRRCYVKYFTLFYGEKVVFSMDGQENTEVRYADLPIRHDGSRYSELDEIIRLKDARDPEGFAAAVREFYVKEQMIDLLL